MPETIVGIATAPGEGGIAIVRLSGPEAIPLFSRVFQGRKPPYPDHLLMHGYITDAGERLDEVMGVVMRAPATYTREDVCEIHTHGGYGAAAAVLELLLRLGAFPAEPGEFTRRAFMNGRIDLVQAEAVMGVISARSAAALREEERQLMGGRSGFVRELQQELTRLLSGLEAHLDYPEEISEEEAVADLEGGLRSLEEKLRRALDERGAHLVQDGLHVALWGLPNAGKSTLFNLLLGEEKAIVTEIPGTTRDVLEGSFQLNGFRVILEDTAGLRSTGDLVEQLGVERAQTALRQADAALLVVDASCPLEQEALELLAKNPGCPCALLLNKSDQPNALEPEAVENLTALRPILSISAREGEGLQGIRSFLDQQLHLTGEGQLTHERHMVLARSALSRLESARESLAAGQPIDLVGIDLHEALYLLGRITGESVDEKLLDDIFSRFCVGK